MKTEVGEYNSDEDDTNRERGTQEGCLISKENEPTDNNNNNSNSELNNNPKDSSTNEDDEEQIVKVERAPSPPLATSPRNEAGSLLSSSHKRKSPSPARLLTTVPMPPSLPPQLTPPLSAEAPMQPPAKIPRMEDSAVQRSKQSQHSLELLCRLYPEQKRGVLEMILKGCNYDLVQAIECILPSHERAIQQLSALPNQSFTLSNGEPQSSEHGIRPYALPPQHKNRSPKLPPTSSAFAAFPTVAPQQPPRHTHHGYGGPCECADCMKHTNGHRMSPRSPKGHPIVTASGKPPVLQQPHRMVPFVPVSSHNPMSEPVKICAGCGGKMKLEDQRCPNCEPEAKP